MDRDGVRYLDGVSSLWANVHGHGVDRIDRAIADQLKKIAHTTMLGLSHEPATVLAKRLIDLAPAGLKRVFYSESGSTAVEIALKMAYQYWRNQGTKEKDTFLKLSNAYHGDTIGAVSVGGMDLFHEIYRPLLFPTLKAPSPSCYRCELGLEPETCAMACAGEVEKILDRDGSRICALIVEPLVQGAAGILTAPEGYLRRIYEACKAHDVLFIADEVAVGFGRTGRMFACEHEGVTPDLMCLGKGITGGYLPLSATLTTEAVYERFLGEHAEYKTFFHGHTYTGNPLSCAAALASLDVFAETQVLEKLPSRIAHFAEELSKLQDHPSVGEIRQRGMMVGIELVADKASKELYPPQDRIGHRVAMACRRHGAVIRPLGDVLVLMPPLSMNDNELSTLVSAVRAALGEVLGCHGLFLGLLFRRLAYRAQASGTLPFPAGGGRRGRPLGGSQRNQAASVRLQRLPGACPGPAPSRRRPASGGRTGLRVGRVEAGDRQQLGTEQAGSRGGGLQTNRGRA